MYRIALCDDNLEYLDLLSTRILEYCAESGVEAKLDCYRDSSQLDDLIDEKKMYDAYILDIASKPGGTDFECAKESGIASDLLLSIPGRFSPKSSAYILARAIERFTLRVK